MIGQQALVIHLAHLVLAGILLFLVVIVIPVTTAAIWRIVVVISALGRAALPESDQRQMRDTTGLLGCCEQHFGAGAIDALELVHGQTVLRVLMFERHGDFLLCTLCAPLVQQRANHRDGRGVGRRRDALL